MKSLYKICKRIKNLTTNVEYRVMWKTKKCSKENKTKIYRQVIKLCFGTSKYLRISCYIGKYVFESTLLSAVSTLWAGT